MWLSYACGTCKYCLTGWETLCPSQQNTGYSVVGCYAEYFLAEAAFATPVPATAYSGLRRGGRLGLVALPASGTLRIPVFDTVLNGTSVIGSIVGTRSDLIDVFALHAAGRTRVSYETRPLAHVNEAIAEVLLGKAKARLFLEP